MTLRLSECCYSGRYSITKTANLRYVAEALLEFQYLCSHFLTLVKSDLGTLSYIKSLYFSTILRPLMDISMHIIQVKILSEIFLNGMVLLPTVT